MRQGPRRYRSVRLASVARPAQPCATPSGPKGQPAIVRWLDLPRLFTLAIFLILLIPAIQPVTDPDFWWHLTTGNWILGHHAVPRHDLYTFTVPDHRWITHEWLSEIVLAAMFATGRLPLVSIVLGLTTAAGFLLVWRAIDRRVNFLIAGLAVALGVAAANPIWGPRIQMVTFTLTALTYLWIKRFCEDERSRALYALPLVMLVWVNLHAGFVIAYVFLGVAFAAELAKKVLARPDALATRRLQQFALIGAASFAAAVINPNTWNIYLYPLQTQFSGVQQRLIVEWFSPNFQNPQIRIFEGMIFLTLAGLAVARRVELRQFLLLLTGLGLALQSVRQMALFAIVATPALADYAQQAWERFRPTPRTGRRRPTNAVTFAANGLVLLLVVATVLAAVTPSLTQRVDGSRVARDFPVQAADFLKAHPPPGHVLNQYGWGGYLIYRLFPDQPVFIYGDAAVAGDQLLQDYAHIVFLHSEQRTLLDRYGVNWTIFPSNDAVTTELRQSQGWFELHTFDKATIMMRDTPQNRAYAAAAIP